MASDPIGNGDGGVDGRESPTEREVPPSLPPLVPQPISTDSSLTEDRSRKRDHNTFENEGPKSCLRKHSKCIKLYRQCFLNGEYCAEGCGCQDCYNSPDHEDTILGVREEIKSENPSAFNRKIMKYETKPHLNSGEAGSRKKDRNTFENEGTKGCFCKYSKCLKLYCQCFLSGEHCAEGCGCQDCYNTPDHEDMVLGVREEIKSECPSAFDRKIIEYETKPHLNTAEAGSRKKDRNTFENEGTKGCFCKYSKCLKLYCQCFLSGEYCAEGCGCHACYNSPDHEDTVLGIREAIKSECPSAFD